MIRISLNDKSKKLCMRCETLYIANYEHVNTTSFATLDIKLWLEEDSDLDTDHPLYSFNQSSKLIQNFVIF